MPKRTKITEMIGMRYSNMRTDLFNYIQRVCLNNYCGFISLTFDVWTAGNQRRCYGAVTAHFIDEGWNLRSFVLAFPVIDFPHTGEHLGLALYGTMQEWKIMPNVFGLMERDVLAVQASSVAAESTSA